MNEENGVVEGKSADAYTVIGAIIAAVVLLVVALLFF